MLFIYAARYIIKVTYWSHSTEKQQQCPSYSWFQATVYASTHFTISQKWNRIILNKRVAMPMHFLETQSFEATPHFMHSFHLWDNSLPRPSIWQSPSFIVIFCSSFVRTARMDVSRVQGNSGTSCSAGPRAWREYARLHHPVSRLTETQRNWT